MDSIDILTGATVRGCRSSEFWLVILAAIALIVLPLTLPRAVGLAALVATYAVSRSIVKAATSRALLTEVTPPVRLTEERGPRPLPGRRD